jgi:hypothetical protein
MSQGITVLIVFLILFEGAWAAAHLFDGETLRGELRLSWLWPIALVQAIYRTVATEMHKGKLEILEHDNGWYAVRRYDGSWTEPERYQWEKLGREAHRKQPYVFSMWIDYHWFETMEEAQEAAQQAVDAEKTEKRDPYKVVGRL